MFRAVFSFWTVGHGNHWTARAGELDFKLHKFSFLVGDPPDSTGRRTDWLLILNPANRHNASTVWRGVFACTGARLDRLAVCPIFAYSVHTVLLDGILKVVPCKLQYSSSRRSTWNDAYSEKG